MSAWTKRFAPLVFSEHNPDYLFVGRAHAFRADNADVADRLVDVGANEAFSWGERTASGEGEFLGKDSGF